MARGFLALVGLMYIGLGLWCGFAPAHTSSIVGFELRPGQGQSEFLTVYGGLEVGLGLIFLAPLWRSEHVDFTLLACLVVHACLVTFRSLGFVMFSGFESATYKLAVAEWCLFLFAAALVVARRRRSPKDATPTT